MSGKIKFFNEKSKKWELVDSGGITDGEKRIDVEDIENIESEISKKINADQVNEELEKKADDKDVIKSINDIRGNNIEITGDSINVKQGSDNKISEVMDLKADKKEIPKNVSDLINDSEYITLEEVPETDLTEIENEINKKVDKGDAVESINDITGKDVTITGESIKLDDDSDISLTESLNTKITQDDIPVVSVNNKTGEIILNAKDIFSEISDSDVDSILKKLGDEIKNLGLNKADKTDIPVKYSELENDKNHPSGNISNITVSTEEPENPENNDIWIDVY